MTSDRASLKGERRVVTALFCDVVGSTSLAEGMDPEDWGEVVAESMRTMGEVVDRYGGTVTEFGGDAVVALFGAPVAHEDDPYRAVRAGLEIADRMRSSATGLDRPLHVRVGIHTGLVVVGDITAGDYNVYSALGDTLNVASRLQSLAQPGCVVISAETRHLLGSDVDARSMGATELKGRSTLVEVYAVDGVRGAAERRRGIPDLTSPMVGRAEELERIVDLAARAAGGAGCAALVVGEPGVGKTRLVTEAEAALAPTGTRWAVGTCVPYDEDLPFHLVASVVRSLAGIGPGASSEVAVKSVRALTADVGASEHDAALERLLGTRSDGDSQSPEELRAEYAAAVGDLVAALADRPMVIVLEDAHWSDASSAAVIGDLVARLRALPVVLLMVMRPERDSEGWALVEATRRDLGELMVELTLSPLDGDDSRALVANLLEIDSLPVNLRRLVLEKAEGNPFFLEEVVRMLIERDLIIERDGRWLATGDIGDLAVPDTVQGLVASRVDLLDAGTRRAGRVAAVIGRRFSSALFGEVFADPPGPSPVHVHPALTELEVHGMLRIEALQPELEYGFRHALIHDVMYEGLLRRERRVLHGEVATALERRYADRLDEVAALLGRHYAAAGRTDEAIRYLLVAARRATIQGARVESSRFYGMTQELLEQSEDPDPTMLIDAVLGRVYSGMGFIPAPESIRWIDSVLPVAKRLGDPDRLAQLYERKVWTRSMQGESYANPDYRRELDAAYALVPQLRDEATAAILQSMMGMAYRSGDDFASAVEPLLAATDGLEAAGRLGDASFNASMAGDVLSQLGRFDEALDAVDRGMDLGRRSGDPNAMLDADLIRGSILADRGDLREALELTRRGTLAAEEVGNTFCNLAGNFKMADQQLRLGNVDVAIGHLEKATGLAQYCNAFGYEALGQAWLAAARSKAGDLQPEAFQEPLDAAVASGSRSSEGLIRLQRAISFAAAGRIEDAADDFERAIVLFADYGGLPNLARAHHAYGAALRASGNTTAAEDHMRTAAALFTDLGIRPDVDADAT